MTIEDVDSIITQDDNDERKAFDEISDKVKEEEEDEKEEEIDETTYQQIKKVDKDIFKKVPELRSVIFREQEYTKVFPSVEDAKQAQEAAEIFGKTLVYS